MLKTAKAIFCWHQPFLLFINSKISTDRSYSICRSCLTTYSIRYLTLRRYMQQKGAHTVAEHSGLFGSAGAARKRIKQNYDARKRGRRARNLLRWWQSWFKNLQNLSLSRKYFYNHFTLFRAAKFSLSSVMWAASRGKSGFGPVRNSYTYNHLNLKKHTSLAAKACLITSKSPF